MKLTLLPTITTLLFLPTAYTSSLEILRFKNVRPSSTPPNPSHTNIVEPIKWDLRLFTPGCDPNTTSFDLSIFHRQGVSGTDGCETLDDASVNVSAVDTFSWKSPGATTYDLCLYDVCGSGNGSGRVEVIRDGWEVCVKYWGWKGWGVVEHGGDC
ncbi:hypothetical protein ASPNIDRAFT_37529 [Aspergillus niger ATCC 1015]|uniref:Uncharacterized protein n=1 Tax=Aspergillus niger (strain ATCC 1015 / CBS 113.46 / FGSC A1144 / LSHB Ac4 / NCTC 3858a / NRRL 328 / USDA 3528.7) TaxID=380704 RepID=G3Y2L6_ASPNA|nr:hypothetical protein ASPNIDRAFT_37529 [Aspergillus niger ATCC 1015]